MVNLSPKFFDAARKLLGENSAITDRQTQQPLLTEWRERWHGFTPLLALPSSTEQLAELVSLCAKHQIAITPQGGNTGLVGGQIPQGEVLISTAKLSQVCQVDKQAMTLKLSAGITLQMAAKAASDHGLLFPLELASGGSATIGGAISTNAGGMAVLRYGNMRNLVLGLEVVLADGTILNGLSALHKDNTGYDLKQIFIGAEGTLGIVTTAILRLFPRPASKSHCWCAVESPQQATELFGFLLEQCPDPMAKFELISQTALELALAHSSGLRSPLTKPAPWSVLIEFETGGSEEPVQNALEKALQAELITDVVVAQSQTQANTLLALRENISVAQKGAGGAIKHDISLPLSAIPKFLNRADQLVLQHIPDTRFCTFGHLGDGNLHYNLLSPLAMNADEFTQQRDVITRSVHDLVQQMGGSFSAEHGIGIARIADLARYKSPTEIFLMRQIKQALDPNNQMNPRLWFEPEV